MPLFSESRLVLVGFIASLIIPHILKRNTKWNTENSTELFLLSALFREELHSSEIAHNASWGSLSTWSKHDERVSLAAKKRFEKQFLSLSFAMRFDIWRVLNDPVSFRCFFRRAIKSNSIPLRLLSPPILASEIVLYRGERNFLLIIIIFMVLPFMPLAFLQRLQRPSNRRGKRKENENIPTRFAVNQVERLNNFFVCFVVLSPPSDLLTAPKCSLALTSHSARECNPTIRKSDLSRKVSRS